MIDTHCHLYLEEFDQDREQVILRAQQQGINLIILPNIDKDSIEKLVATYELNTNLFRIALGLHPTSVKADYKDQLGLIFNSGIDFVAIGETGIDLYWDKTWFKEQQESFDFQLNMACEMKLPVIIHSRNSIVEVMDILSPYKSKRITGVFHCFPGNLDNAKKVIDLGMYIGIGGVLTYKNNNMTDVVRNIPLEYIITETDSPYLSPVPHRGKRNEPAYVNLVAEQIAILRNVKSEEINRITETNAKRLFNFNVVR